MKKISFLLMALITFQIMIGCKTMNKTEKGGLIGAGAGKV